MSRKRFSVKDARLQESIGALLQDQIHVGEGRLETLPTEMIQTAAENPRYVGRVTPEEIIAHRESRIDLNSESGDRAAFFAKVQDLANSIARRGLLQPIVVREDKDGFRVLAGERRLLAHILLGRERIRAIIRPAAEELEERSIRLIENLQRENLTFAELVRGIEELDAIFQEEHGRAMDSTDLAAELHKHDSTCRRYLQVVRAPKDVREAIEAGTVSGLRPALALIDIEAETDRIKVLKRMEAGDLTENAIRQAPSPAPSPLEPRRGRRRTQVTLGSVKEMVILQRLMTSLLGSEAFSVRYASLDWDDLDAVQQAWEDLMKDVQRGLV